jgi:sugar phosphate isomerase/epimerase
MFSLGVISDEVSQDPRRVIQVCGEFGVRCVEPRSVWNTPPQGLADEQIVELASLLREAGLVVPCIASPFLKCDLGDAEQYAAHLDLLRRCIHLAHVLGCRVIRGFTFWKTGPADAVWQQLLDAYAEPIRLCEAEDVILGIENEASTHIATAAEAERMYQDLGSQRVRAIWDPANEVYAADGELPFPVAFERMKPYMVHMHIKDAVRDPAAEGGARCVPVGEGRYIDFPAQFAALADMGYEGACSLETHWRPAAALSEDLLNRPGGAAFSEGGEEASRICLRNIGDMLKALDIRPA